MSELALIQEFERRLGAAGGTLPELTELRDRGHALLELFRRRRAMLDDKNALTLRLIEVERQISLYLAGLPRSPGGRPAQNSFHGGTSFSEEAPTFEDAIQNVGLSRTTAWRIQTLALVPEVDLQAHVHAIIADGKELTLKAVYDLAQPLAAQQREQERQAELTVQLARFHATVEVDLKRQITRQDAADLQDWGDGELDVLLTSPPYATGQPYAGGGDVDPEAYPDCVRAWVAEMFRVMHPEHGRALVVVPFDTSWLPVSALWQMALVQAGFKYRPSVVIHDGDAGSRLGRGSVDSAVAPAVVAPIEVVLVVYRGRTWARSTDRVSDLDHYAWLDHAGPRGLWTSARAHDPLGHPAPFSPSLVRDVLEMFSFREDLVGDPFVGTGTTPTVCLEMGRRFVASDRAAEYVERTRARVSEARAKLSR